MMSLEKINVGFGNGGKALFQDGLCWNVSSFFG
jgi:hypothetical protein